MYARYLESLPQIGEHVKFGEWHLACSSLIDRVGSTPKLYRDYHLTAMMNYESIGILQLAVRRIVVQITNDCACYVQIVCK